MEYVNEHKFINRLAENSVFGGKQMDINVGETDRLVRLVVGIVLLAVAVAGFAELFTYEPITSTVGLAILAVIGLVLVATGALRQCALYRLLGINTRT